MTNSTTVFLQSYREHIKNTIPSGFHEKISSPLTYTVDNYDPLPQSIFIPENLRPFIPTTPVYIAPSEGSKYLAPGSPGWFKYLYDQEQKTKYRRQRDIQEQESKRKKLEAEKQHKARVAYFSTSYVTQTHWIHRTPRSDTSDNTKEIETRPPVGPSNSK
ncbi:hypothetical protein C1646_809586 [Rhizophagus diaphanus]|nr:hypothetical protein C1646_809586 [Rhizophagus diaphanus] [Rhizophagus sp. MUCL 43196]